MDMLCNCSLESNNSCRMVAFSWHFPTTDRKRIALARVSHGLAAIHLAHHLKKFFSFHLQVTIIIFCSFSCFIASYHFFKNTFYMLELTPFFLKQKESITFYYLP